jgi:hypothetical protein
VTDNNGVMTRDTLGTRHGAIVRSKSWNGVRYGDAVVVNGARERRQTWIFVAFALNESTGEEWVEVRGVRARGLGSSVSRSLMLLNSH